MVITLNIQGASPEEIRETCKQFAEMGINNRIVVKPEDLGGVTLPRERPAARVPHHRWKDDEILYAVDLYEKGVAYKAISEAIKTRFNISVTPAAVSRIIERFRNQK